MKYIQEKPELNMSKVKKTEEQKKALRTYKQLVNADKQKLKKKELYEKKEWYTARALLGNQWANWFVMAGARER